MRKKRQTFKGHSFSLRVPEKVRYGLDLLARKHHVQMSALVMRAIDKMFDDEGLNSRDQGQLLSLLDKLWSDSESERIFALQAHAPELMTPEEQIMRMILDTIKVSKSKEILLNRLDQNALLGELCFDPRVSDTFANDVLKANQPLRSEVADTVALKAFAKELYDDLNPAP